MMAGLAVALPGALTSPGLPMLLRSAFLYQPPFLIKISLYVANSHAASSPACLDTLSCLHMSCAQMCSPHNQGQESFSILCVHD